MASWCYMWLCISIINHCLCACVWPWPFLTKNPRLATVAKGCRTVLSVRAAGMTPASPYCCRLLTWMPQINWWGHQRTCFHARLYTDAMHQLVSASAVTVTVTWTWTWQARPETVQQKWHIVSDFGNCIFICKSALGCRGQYPMFCALISLCADIGLGHFNWTRTFYPT
jgi:hypothetical protein